MTVEQVVRAVARRWYVVVVGLLVTTLAIAGALGRAGVYTTQVDMIFLAPSHPASGYVLEGSPDSLIYFAAIVEREVNGGKRPPRLSSPSASLFGTGVRDGYRVNLPDTGGQWANSFTRPVLDVEVVASSPERVTSILDSVVARIDKTAIAHERAAGADPSTWISTELAPSTPVIVYVPGEPHRAALALGLLGTVLTALGAVGFDRRRTASRRPALIHAAATSLPGNA